MRPQDRQRQSGQLTLGAALILPFFVMLLGFLLNLSLLTHQKIRLQNAADAAVYSASASMARDLNQITELNENIAWLYHSRGPVPDGLYRPPPWGGAQKEGFLNMIQDTAFNGEQIAKNHLKEYSGHYRAIKKRIDAINEDAISRAQHYGSQAALLTFYNGNASRAGANPLGLEFTLQFAASQEALPPCLTELAEHKAPVTLGFVKGPKGAADAGEGNGFLEAEINTPLSKTSLVRFTGRAAADLGWSLMLPERYRVSAQYQRGDRLQAHASAGGQPYGGSVSGLQANYQSGLVRTEDASWDD